MIVPVMAISNLVLTQQIYSEETNGAHAHYREPVNCVPLSSDIFSRKAGKFMTFLEICVLIILLVPQSL